MKGNIWTVAIVAVLVGVVLVGADVQFAAAETTVEIDDEEHTLSQTEASTLDGASEWTEMDQNEVVTTVETGETLERGVDYDINYTDGNITASDGEYDGEDVLVDYSYVKPDETTGNFEAILTVFAPLMGVLLLVVSVGVIIGWTGLFGSGGGR